MYNMLVGFLAQMPGGLNCQLSPFHVSWAAWERAHAQLGYRLVGCFSDETTQAAVKLVLPEAALAAIDELGSLGLRPSHAVCDAYHAGVVVRTGRRRECGDRRARRGVYLLRGTTHVRIIAPTLVRIERIARRKERASRPGAGGTAISFIITTSSVVTASGGCLGSRRTHTIPLPLSQAAAGSARCWHNLCIPSLLESFC